MHVYSENHFQYILIEKSFPMHFYYQMISIHFIVNISNAFYSKYHFQSIRIEIVISNAF